MQHLGFNIFISILAGAVVSLILGYFFDKKHQNAHRFDQPSTFKFILVVFLVVAIPVFLLYQYLADS